MTPIIIAIVACAFSIIGIGLLLSVVEWRQRKREAEREALLARFGAIGE